MKLLHRYEVRFARASVFLWIGLLCLFGWVSDLPQTQHPALFVALLGVHVVLHWVMLYRTVPPRWRLAYFAVQGVIVFGIGLAQPYVTLPLGLLAILASQATAYGLSLPQLGGLIVVYVLLMTAVAASVMGVEYLTLAPVWASAFLLMVVAGVLLYRRQVRARNHAEVVAAELKQAHDQLRAYAQRVEELILMTERQRMARELHDTLAQGLAGVILQLEATEAHLINGRTGRAQEVVQHAMVRARTSLADARRTIDNLRNDQATVEDFGAALRAEIERVTAPTPLVRRLDLGALPALPEPVQEHVLRAVTESVTNVVHHARAAHVWVHVTQEKNMLTLEIRDDGIGFEPATISRQRGHYGLLGLHERAHLTGGEVLITSVPGAGTTVRLRLPVAAEVAA